MAQWIGQTGGLGAAVRVHAVCQAIWERRTLLAHTHTHTRILFSHKKEEILPFVTTWMALEGIMLSEVNQTGKDTYCKISLKCRI